MTNHIYLVSPKIVDDDDYIDVVALNRWFDVVYSTIVDASPIYFARMARDGSWEIGLSYNSDPLEAFANSLGGLL